jgi:hypothetical protein
MNVPPGNQAKSLNDSGTATGPNDKLDGMYKTITVVEA